MLLLAQTSRQQMCKRQQMSKHDASKLDEWDFWKRVLYKSLAAFWGKSGEPDFLTYFEYAGSDKPGSQAKFWVLDHLICINKMAAKLPLLLQCEAVSIHKSVTKRTKWTTEMSFSMKWTSVNRIGSVLTLKWYGIFITMQISGQICKLMAINVEIPFLLIISVKQEHLKCLFQWNKHQWIGLGHFWGLKGMQYSLICKLVVKYAN